MEAMTDKQIRDALRGKDLDVQERAALEATLRIRKTQEEN